MAGSSSLLILNGSIFFLRVSPMTKCERNVYTYQVNGNVVGGLADDNVSRWICQRGNEHVMNSRLIRRFDRGNGDIRSYVAMTGLGSLHTHTHPDMVISKDRGLSMSFWRLLIDRVLEPYHINRMTSHASPDRGRDRCSSSTPKTKQKRHYTVEFPW
jgi:hypothetical protein